MHLLISHYSLECALLRKTTYSDHNCRYELNACRFKCVTYVVASSQIVLQLNCTSAKPQMLLHALLAIATSAIHTHVNFKTNIEHLPMQAPQLQLLSRLVQLIACCACFAAVGNAGSCSRSLRCCCCYTEHSQTAAVVVAAVVGAAAAATALPLTHT